MKLISITPFDLKNTDSLIRIEKMEKVKTLDLITFHDGRFKNLASVRWYMSRSNNAQVVYCVVRLNSYLMPVEYNDQWSIAIGKDDHFGQDRMIYSFNNALKHSGIVFDEKRSIEEPETILELIAKANYNNYEHLHFVRG